MLWFTSWLPVSMPEALLWKICLDCLRSHSQTTSLCQYSRDDFQLARALPVSVLLFRFHTTIPNWAKIRSVHAEPPLSALVIFLVFPKCSIFPLGDSSAFSPFLFCGSLCSVCLFVPYPHFPLTNIWAAHAGFRPGVKKRMQALSPAHIPYSNMHRRTELWSVTHTTDHPHWIHTNLFSCWTQTRFHPWSRAFPHEQVDRPGRLLQTI